MRNIFFSFLSVHFRSSINPISTGVVYLPYADFMACAGSDCDYVDAGSGSESGLDGFRPLPPPHPLVVGFISPCHRLADPLPLSATCSKAGRNHINKEITPLLPTG